MDSDPDSSDAVSLLRSISTTSNLSTSSSSRSAASAPCRPASVEPLAADRRGPPWSSVSASCRRAWVPPLAVDRLSSPWSTASAPCPRAWVPRTVSADRLSSPWSEPASPGDGRQLGGAGGDLGGLSATLSPRGLVDDDDDRTSVPRGDGGDLLLVAARLLQYMLTFSNPVKAEIRYTSFPTPSPLCLKIHYTRFPVTSP